SPDAINVTTVHDFVYERYIGGIRLQVHHAQKSAAIRRSAGVICVSNHTLSDFQKWFPTYSGRLMVVPHGVNRAFYEIAAKHDASRSILFVGKRGGYKNFRLLADAAERLEDYRLEIVGGGKLTASERAHLERVASGRYFHHGVVSDEQLNELYNRCHCLVYPSEYEGFGMPVLEAMAAGCPVVATRCASIPEVAGQAALYVDGITAADIEMSVRKLESPSLRRRHIELGRQQASKFTWENARKLTYQLYRQLLVP
ncbi:MAG TPA: glycosyltransferase family 1 protein, partial [Spirochaetia bacterium]|nr:glycosyltransferase family 1 protein [Spirochaetia bacterium]